MSTSNQTPTSSSAATTAAVQYTIRERRTVKTPAYNGKIIDRSLIDRLLQAADWAPTHGLTEPWRFIIFDGAAIPRFCLDHAELYRSNTEAEDFREAAYEKLKNQGNNVSHIIAVFSKRGSKEKITVQEEICATAAAVQNILLMATSMGISSFWSTGGQTLKAPMHQYFKLRPEDHMVGLIYLGYSDQPPSQGRRLTPLDEKVMWYHK